MTRHLQNKADAARSLTWRRRGARQGTATRVGLLAAVGTAPFAANDSTRAGSKSNATPGPGTTRTEPVGTPAAPVTVRLVERIPSGTDPLRDLAIVNILARVGVKPSGPKTVMLVGDLADGIADGSIRLDHGDPHHRRRTRQWEAPLFFGEMRRVLIDRIRTVRGSAGISRDELVCTMAQAMRVPNNDSANIRFIDAVWTSRPDAALGDRPTARGLTSLRAAFRRRNAVSAPKPPHTAGGTAA